MVSYFWGWLADKQSKKTILMYSGICMALSSFFFGFSFNFYVAVIFRFLLGLSNGTKLLMANCTLFCEYIYIYVYTVKFISIIQFRDHGDLNFLAKKFTPKPASQLHLTPWQNWLGITKSPKVP